MFYFCFSEEGNYLALDLGGTNFRVLLVSLKGQKVDIKSKMYLISKALMVGPGEQVRVSSYWVRRGGGGGGHCKSNQFVHSHVRF